jgi:hypothetical protein
VVGEVTKMTKSLSVVLACLFASVASAQPAPTGAPPEVETVEPAKEEIDLDKVEASSEQEPDPEKDLSSTPCAPPVEEKTITNKSKSMKPKPQKMAKMQIGIASIKNWPEFKVTHPVKTVAKILGKKIKTKVPQSWRRSCKKQVFAEVTYPKDLEDKGKAAIKSCSKKAAVASVIVAVETGPASALPTFVGALEACVKIESAKLANEVNASIDTDKDCSKWKKV